VHHAVAPLVVEGEEAERRRPEVAEARGEDLALPPEEVFEPRSGLRDDETPERDRERDDRERVGQRRRPRDPDVGHRPGLGPGTREVDVRGHHLERVPERGGAELHPVAPPEGEPPASRDDEAVALDLPQQGRRGRTGRGALGDLRGPEEVEVLLDVDRPTRGFGRETPREVHRDGTEPRAHIGDHEEGTDQELGVRPGGEEDLAVSHGGHGRAEENGQSHAGFHHAALLC